jgi:hypothetical protein
VRFSDRERRGPRCSASLRWRFAPLRLSCRAALASGRAPSGCRRAFLRSPSFRDPRTSPAQTLARPLVRGSSSSTHRPVPPATMLMSVANYPPNDCDRPKTARPRVDSTARPESPGRARHGTSGEPIDLHERSVSRAIVGFLDRRAVRASEDRKRHFRQPRRLSLLRRALVRHSSTIRPLQGRSRELLRAPLPRRL